MTEILNNFINADTWVQVSIGMIAVFAIAFVIGAFYCLVRSLGGFVSHGDYATERFDRQKIAKTKNAVGKDDVVGVQKDKEAAAARKAAKLAKKEAKLAKKEEKQKAKLEKLAQKDAEKAKQLEEKQKAKLDKQAQKDAEKAKKNGAVDQKDKKSDRKQTEDPKSGTPEANANLGAAAGAAGTVGMAAVAAGGTGRTYAESPMVQPIIIQCTPNCGGAYRAPVQQAAAAAQQIAAQQPAQKPATQQVITQTRVVEKIVNPSPNAKLSAPNAKVKVRVVNLKKADKYLLLSTGIFCAGLGAMIQRSLSGKR